MLNVLFELDRLRVILQNKGFDYDTANAIVDKASQEINSAFEQHGGSAMQQAIELGVDSDAPDFINELQLDRAHMLLTTQSGSMDFTEPPYPMLPQLLKNAKPMKDGSGVYKVIPVGQSNGQKRNVATNIYDAYKQINAERIETAKKQYQAVSPKGSKTQFRTATSKQDPSSKWVQPTKIKNFQDNMQSINEELSVTMGSIVRDIIRTYEEGF